MNVTRYPGIELNVKYVGLSCELCFYYTMYKKQHNL